VPILSIKNGAGPTLVIMAGNHGDEHEGQIAISTLARELNPADICGRLILMPMVNYPAAQAGLRTSPIDEGNLNRLFPGNAAGSPTEMIAHYIEDVLMPLTYYAFDLPYAWVFTGGGGRNSTAMGAANRNGVINVMAELGGGRVVTPDVLQRTERGLRRILYSLDMLPNYTPDAAQDTRELNAQGSVFSYTAGVFEPLRSIGEDVSVDEAVGRIHHPDTPQSEPDMIISPYAGIVLCKRAMAQVVRGDAAFHIASDAAPRAAKT
jgi:predicted deacylase|tara:strand:- start:350 stop:1141 length:792 start_codon:yes stop_codon:yes gene_type:complete